MQGMEASRAQHAHLLPALYTVRPADGMLWIIRDPYTRLRPRQLRRGAVGWQDVASSADAAHVKIAS